MTICPNLSDDQVKLAFSKFDTSGDDKLDYREFCEMIKQKVGGGGVRLVLFIIFKYLILQVVMEAEKMWLEIADIMSMAYLNLKA